MSEKLMVFVWNFGLPLLLIPLAIPMMLERVRPNWWYGFRTRKTLSDEGIWYKANAYAGSALLLAGVVTLVGLLVLVVIESSLSYWPFNILGWVVGLVPIVVAIILSFVYVGKL